MLPFVDMSQAKDQEYFSDGLSEELLNLLAQLPQLKVIARTSSFSFKGKEVDVATIARQLNVAHILEGSVRKSGNTLRVTAQLVRASDSTHLWSQTYDRELTDVFKVQDEIAAAVVEALKVKLLPGQDMSSAHRSSNTEAYNQYLLGRQFTRARTRKTGGARSRPTRRRSRSTPATPPRYAALSESRGRLGDSAGDEAWKDRRSRTRSKAIASRHSWRMAYLSRGTSRLALLLDLPARRRTSRRRSRSIHSPLVQGTYARLLMVRGTLPEAIAWLRKAVELDPLSAGDWGMLGRMFNAAGRFPAAREALDRSLEINPESNVVLFHRGMNDLLQAGPGKPWCSSTRRAAVTAARAGPWRSIRLATPEASQAEMEAEIAEFSQGAAYQIAEAYAWRGETDKAFEWLERAHAQHDGGLTFIKADPLMASIKHDPRFAAMLKKLGMPQ